ncbi:hypothetical protein COU74_05295 [Candidatus Peregrinibacteria bacterium CG10_big_fil_rev_8_21_14_0_10_36_19]|nr:MAG: hypothetical protein COU74_05295 [Candidatus Peregrinibacteria bacterium CG10_big_fil_rev_8_21_14_0_10_36_19]
MSFKGSLKKSHVVSSEEGYNKYATAYDDSLGYLNSFENDVLLKFFGDLRGKKVLDVGCGTGRIIHDLHMAGAEVCAVDLSDAMLKITKKKFPMIETAQADIRKLPFENESFDMVVATFLLVHLDKLEEAFDEVNRVLKVGGEFIVTNINQKKAPKLKTKDGETVVIESFYHRPENVLNSLDRSFFKIDKEEFVYDDKVWVNQIVKAVKF